MRWPRLTTRRIMASVFVLAIGLGLGVPAGRVALDEADHPHRQPIRMDGVQVPGWAGGTIHLDVAWSVDLTTQARTPFWPRYWRCLAGLPWQRVPGCCERNAGQPGETCSYEDPDPTMNPNGPAASIFPVVEQVIPNRFGSRSTLATTPKVL